MNGWLVIIFSYLDLFCYKCDTSYFDKQETDLNRSTIKGIFIKYFQDLYSLVHDVVCSNELMLASVCNELRHRLSGCCDVNSQNYKRFKEFYFVWFNLQHKYLDARSLKSFKTLEHVESVVSLLLDMAAQMYRYCCICRLLSLCSKRKLLVSSKRKLF